MLVQYKMDLIVISLKINSHYDIAENIGIKQSITHSVYMYFTKFKIPVFQNSFISHFSNHHFLFWGRLGFLVHTEIFLFLVLSHQSFFSNVTKAMQVKIKKKGGMKHQIFFATENKIFFPINPMVIPLAYTAQLPINETTHTKMTQSKR